MKFGEQLSSHLTPEWRKQYIDYEGLKAILYQLIFNQPCEEEAKDQYFADMDVKFLAQCEVQLTRVNLFFSQKIAEAQNKYHELSSEISDWKELMEMPVDRRQAAISLRRGFTGIKKTDVFVREEIKTVQQLKLAFSEFYLSLVLLQNYQQLNATGFRKILKKHDKLFSNESGSKWRVNRVEKSSFFLNREVENLISNVETVVINDLEGGNRQAGMKRLKVPPLSEKQHAGVTFALGLFMGAFIVLVFVILLTWYAVEPRTHEPKWVAVRLFRGPLLLFVSIWLCGLNMYGWTTSGVNHVLIFEVDPRNHITYQSVMQIASFLCMAWALCVIGYFYAHLLNVSPFIFPLILFLLCVLLLINPIKKPKRMFLTDSMRWLVKHCFFCITAPTHYVTFADFWLGDQMNSLVTSFLDFQYFACFYVSEVDYSNWSMTVRTMNASLEEDVPWGYVDLNTGRDRCTTASGARAFMSMIPATIRFMQCLRRFRDTRSPHPHLINAGKYGTTYFVILFKTLNHVYEQSGSPAANYLFYSWVAFYVISFTYTFLWDVFMDWGLIDANAPKDAPFLREEMIYGSKYYYYLAIVEDFVLRLSWVLNVSLGEAWTVDSEFLTCITAPLEIFRRFIWNYFRLENEHINNCGQFRAVRDISIKPIKKGDLELLISKIDQEDGVVHRGALWREQVKRQKKVVKAKRPLLRRSRFIRSNVPPSPDSSIIITESKH